MVNKTSVSVSAFAFLLVLWASPICVGRQIAPPGDETAGTEIQVIIRFSNKLFENLTQQEIKMDFPIHRTVEGMEVNGTVEAIGHTTIELKTSSEGAEFVISVPGTANASFSTDAGPATAHASSVSHFASQKRISFDGADFQQGPTRVTVQSCACVDLICPNRQGPIGKVIKKAGWCIARKNIEKIREAVDDAAQEIVAQTFDEKATELLDMLNEISIAELDDIVTKYFPETESYINHLATLQDSIIAGAGPEGARFPKLPPALAHVELWLKTRPLEAAFLELLVEWNVAHDLLKEYLDEEDAKLIAEDLSVETVNGWTVLRIGVEKQEEDGQGRDQQ